MFINPQEVRCVFPAAIDRGFTIGRERSYPSASIHVQSTGSYSRALASSTKKIERGSRMESEGHQHGQPAPVQQTSINAGLSEHTEINRYVAIDCEMVGIGPNPGSESALARVSIVNFKGDQIYDSYVKPKEAVTDWRTHVSGIAPKHMIAARTLEAVQLDVARILNGRILIGHSIRNDLDALLLSHPKRDIRDTARYPPYRLLAGGGSPRLKILASELLGIEIQSGEHSSVEDARATMLLYQREKDGFERHHAKNFPNRPEMSTRDNNTGSASSNKKKKNGKKKR